MALNKANGELLIIPKKDGQQKKYCDYYTGPQPKEISFCHF